MSSRTAIADIQKSHNGLYKMLLDEHTALLSSKTRGEAFIEEAKRLFKEMEAASQPPTRVEDYEWLKSATTAWRLAFPTLLNTPCDINLAPPPEGMRRPGPTSVMSEDDIQKRIDEKAFEVYKYRKVGEYLRAADNLLKQIQAQEWGEEMDQDRFVAEVEFATEVLEGQINFAHHLKSASYKHLEGVWLSDVKKLRAYHLSLRERGEGPRDEVKNYYQACGELREMLVSEAIKAPANEFGEARAYLNSTYLKDGRLDLSNRKTKDLIALKAFHCALASGEQDNEKNWKRGESYVVMFYENIIGAVEEEDFEKILLVLKALQLSGEAGIRYRIINSFETSLAVYFLNPNVIREIWRQAEGRHVPGSWAVSEVDAQAWPQGFETPKECKRKIRFDTTRRRLTFDGVMTDEQREALLDRNNRREHREAIEELYARSRLLPRDTTL